jgi:hypothetical protein
MSRPNLFKTGPSIAPMGITNMLYPAKDTIQLSLIMAMNIPKLDITKPRKKTRKALSFHCAINSANMAVPMNPHSNTNTRIQ